MTANGIPLKDIEGFDDIKERIGLAHDCCLYARSYFETRQKSNNPDNELGKTLKAIKLLDEVWTEIQTGSIKIGIDREKVAKKLYELHNYSRTFESNKPKWEDLSEDNKNLTGFRWQADEISKIKTLLIVVKEENER
ncbi:MAG TPA: hypothetical protein VII94_05830 [Candidatus Saccharimonadales bacterium]